MFWFYYFFYLFTQPFIRRRSKKTSKLRVTGLCAGDSPVTGEFPAQMTSNAENISIWWPHHGYDISICFGRSIYGCCCCSLLAVSVLTFTNKVCIWRRFSYCSPRVLIIYDRCRGWRLPEVIYRIALRRIWPRSWSYVQMIAFLQWCPRTMFKRLPPLPTCDMSLDTCIPIGSALLTQRYDTS